MNRLFLAALLAAAPAVAQTEINPPPPPPTMDNHGIGFGMNAGENRGIGLNLFYDLNLAQHSIGLSQLHTAFAYGTSERSSAWIDTIKIQVQTFRLNSTYRFVMRGGFFAGAGLGYTQGTNTYKASSYYTSTAANDSYALDSSSYTYISNFSSFFANADIGWQGNRGYYFSVGYQPAINLSSSSDFEISNIPDVSNHRSASQDMEDYAAKNGLLSVGFGWFLQ